MFVLVVGDDECCRKGVSNLEMLLELDGQDLRHLEAPPLPPSPARNTPPAGPL